MFDMMSYNHEAKSNVSMIRSDDGSGLNNIVVLEIIALFLLEMLVGPDSPC